MDARRLRRGNRYVFGKGKAILKHAKTIQGLHTQNVKIYLIRGDV
jgi:hypothetical protein